VVWVWAWNNTYKQNSDIQHQTPFELAARPTIAMTDTKQCISIRVPDDMHLHVRDGDALRAVISHAATRYKAHWHRPLCDPSVHLVSCLTRFARAIIMPNLVPPVTTCDAAAAYRERILKAVSDEVGWLFSCGAHTGMLV